MQIQAPSQNDQISAIITALSSYNRPVILILCMVISFFISYLASKKNLPVSFIISTAITLLVAVYFIFGYTSQIRY